MKKLTLLFVLFGSLSLYAQTTGSVVGKLIDKEFNDEPLAFANVIIKGTSIGAISDIDGLYGLEDLEPGTYTLIYSFVGYETHEIEVVIEAGKVTEVNVPMGASAASLDEIIITTTTRKESETALLLEQKKAAVIVESIGAQRLTEIGVTDAANATTKISGVTRSEGSGDIYIRGLGDRYLSTTMNGLPIPSDDVNNKNINLDLFSTNVIENIGISKTYATNGYADQASGNVNVSSKGYSKKGFSISVNGGGNTNVFGLDGDFKRSIISEDVTFGFHQKQYAVVDLITRQGWEPINESKSPNYGFRLTGGYKFEVFGKELSVFASGSHRKSFNYQEGLFRSYRSNILDNEFTDVQSFTSNSNTTGYANVKLLLNDKNNIQYNFLGVNKGIDNVYEQGRNGLGFVFDQDPQEEGAFVRDQNFKQTTMFVNQLLGSHKITDNNELEWAGGYNFVLAEEPNRIRNEANILNATTVQYAHVGDFQQRKSSQKIEDEEYNAYLVDHLGFGTSDEYGVKPFKLHIGANFRQKERKFNSLFIGVRAKGFQVPSVDMFSQTFTEDNFNNGLVLREREPDRYFADLSIYSGFANMDFKLNKFSGNFGFRYEIDKIDVTWDVANYVGRVGSIAREYKEFYPSVNLKYELNEKHFLRLASSLTQTLPEFKELSPFEYVSPTGRVTRGNPDLEKSDVINLDLKWEFFPKNSELISLATFYKKIENPINLTQTRGSSGIFQYYNTGEKADIFGVELETRLNIIENEDEEGIVDVNMNITKMWFNQDLFENYQYKGIKESELQGASDFIFNGAVSFKSQSENQFMATLTGNYSSDKIFALGSPEDFNNSAVLYNDEIIEKGFFTLGLVVSKKLGKNLELRLSGQNLLNPDIKQTQGVRNINTGVNTNELVSSYKNGVDTRLTITYNF
ncbi:TonB-dependent receptor [Flavobacteriaceae bacterium XHP0103]|uniref:outer membrane beta-barrel protein n=1 Tax=Marixanthotalea marina TaxID=2844359 RepID=UPI002989D50B|nr:outer membrane beta-barrel protein [Marixanthotalea marina]MBU3822174.1 TonB-dependent receptor [Marixanthotalea marina]